MSAEDATAAKIRRIFACRRIALTRLFVNENRPCLRIRMARRNCREGKQNHPLARLGPSQAMATGISSRRIDRDYPMIRHAAFGRAPRRLRDLTFQRNHSKIGIFHSSTYVPPSSRASTKFGQRILRSSNFRRRTGKDRQSAQLDVLRKPIVTIFQGLGIVQVVSRVVIEHLLRITCGGSVVFHGSFIEILFEVGELNQERNRRGVTDEMNSIDVADDLYVSLQLTGRPAVSKVNYAEIPPS